MDGRRHFRSAWADSEANPGVTTTAVAEGSTIAGKYRVERVLGKGAIGVVVAAQHLHLHERVAIKLLLPEAAAQPDIAARFLREGCAAVKIRGEHVARVM